MNKEADPVSVLVVDDEEGIREGSKHILDRMGCIGMTAARGEEGLDILEREDVRIVLLDLKMPGMDGMEALEIIGQKHPDVLVIVITGYATLEIAVEAMKRGAYDFIPKPFEWRQLRIVVNRAREKVHLENEARRLHLEKEHTLTDLGMEKSRTHTIINALPNGILVTNSKGRVVLMNPAFHHQMGLPTQVTPGEQVEAYIQDKGLCQLVNDISQGRRVDFDDIPPYEFAIGSDTYLLARGRPVMGDKRVCLGAVITLQDITAMKVVDRLKSEFVANVSHELRSPLSTIHEQLAVVLNKMVGHATGPEEHLISRAKEKTQGLISLIGDLLDISRIESGAVCQAPKPMALEDLLEDIIDFLSTRAAAKNITLTLEQPKVPLPAIKADPLAIESIFGNLLTNAINYTPGGGRIQVNIAHTGINIQVQVIDNGLGIEERHIDKIFDRFYRVKTEKTRYITGTGLGLPIVRGLVDSLGGRISVESALEEGSTFTVLLPIIMQA